MSTNHYFQGGYTSGTTSEQRLIEDLIIESVKIYGHDVFYLPRTSIKQDNVFGEDTLSQFDHAYPLEMYLQNVEGWDGDGDLFTKFGYFNNDINNLSNQVKNHIGIQARNEFLKRATIGTGLEEIARRNLVNPLINRIKESSGSDNE